jgi:hypothetical protein
LDDLLRTQLRLQARTRFPRQASAEKEKGNEGQGLDVIARSKIYDVLDKYKNK